MQHFKYYYVDYNNHKVKIYISSIFERDLPSKTIQIFKLEFSKLNEVNVESVSNLLESIYNDLKRRKKLSKVFIVSQKDGYIRVSFQKKYFMDIYEK